MPSKELDNHFAMNIYMFFDEENCPQNPYDLETVFTREQRNRMLEVFRAHREGLRNGAEQTYYCGYGIRIKDYQEIGAYIRFDGMTAEVASIASLYKPQFLNDENINKEIVLQRVEPQIESLKDGNTIKKIVLRRVEPQIESFVEGLTYYLAIHE